MTLGISLKNVFDLQPWQKMLPLCALSAAVYYVRGGLPVSSSLGYLLGGAAGGVLAGRIFGRLRTLWLRRAFALLILYGGIRAVLLL